MKLPRTLLLLPLLVGCAQTPDPARNEGRLTLLTPLTIPAQQTTVRLQGGRTVARNGVDEYHPFCVFEVNALAATDQVVQPDEFRITSIQRSLDTLYAALPQAQRAVWRRTREDATPSHLYFKTWFRLHSPRQPEVRALVCLHDQIPLGSVMLGRHLTLGEMRAALGAGFRLEPGWGDGGI